MGVRILICLTNKLGFAPLGDSFTSPVTRPQRIVYSKKGDPTKTILQYFNLYISRSVTLHFNRYFTKKQFEINEIHQKIQGSSAKQVKGFQGLFSRPRYLVVFCLKVQLPSKPGKG